jgi:hypothetical protein
VFTLTEGQHDRKEGRDRIKLQERRILRQWRMFGTAAITFMGLIAMPFQALAAGPLTASKAQVAVGTLPLLAALGLGIAVAVGAVIAFLQMTAKGKAFSGISRTAASEEADLPIEPYAADSWSVEDIGTESEYDEDPLTDYTIPITQILAAPDAAEPARGGEPRLCGIEGEHAGASYRLLGRRLLIGRDAGQCGVVFPYEAGEVSRRHCTVRYNPEARVFLLEDHGSSNGTFLENGARLEPGKLYELRDGEKFSLSGAQHSFEVKAGD